MAVVWGRGRKVDVAVKGQREVSLWWVCSVSYCGGGCVDIPVTTLVHVHTHRLESDHGVYPCHCTVFARCCHWGRLGKGFSGALRYS